MSKTNPSYDIQAAQMGGDGVGDSGTFTGTTGTTGTDSGKSWTTNQWAGHYVASAGVIGVIQSNTATALTIDRWNTPSSPEGAAGTTPGNVAYVILPGNAPAMFVALSANTSGVVGTDTTLAGEITTAGGGLVRKRATFAHTASATSYTLTSVHTANGSDTLPVTIGKAAYFQTVAATTGKSLFQTLVSPTATMSASGDQLTLTDTVSM